MVVKRTKESRRIRHMRLSVLRAVGIATVSMTIGCTSLSGLLPHKEPKAIAVARGGDPSATPFKLEVTDETNKGDVVVVRGRVIGKRGWTPSQAVVRLTALDTEGEQRVSFHKLSDFNPSKSSISRGEPASFALSIPSVGVSNYQLELLWGDDAEPYLNTNKASLKLPQKPKEYLALRNLEVHRVPDGSCSSPEECLVTFAIKGEFYNSGSRVVSDVVLKAGFCPADKLDLPDYILENERRIEVRNMTLKPGGTKPFRLSLEKLVPASDTVAYQPVVRIISFESEKAS